MTSDKSRYVSDELNKIWNETREANAYALGIANGYYYFYQYYKSEYGEEVAHKSFQSIFDGTDKYNEYFKKIVELDEIKESDVGEVMNSIKECLGNK